MWVKYTEGGYKPLQKLVFITLQGMIDNIAV
jgi:hypothetical protein